MGLFDFLKGSKAKEAEEKEFKWILMEFYRFKLVDKALKSAKKSSKSSPEKAKRKIKKALRLLRKEERTEMRLARGFSRMEGAVGEDLKKIANEHPKKFQGLSGKINDLYGDLEKAEVFNADLEKEAARGGKIEKLLKASEGSVSKLDETIKEIEKVMKELKGFEVQIEKIKDETSEIDKEIEGDMDEEEKKEELKAIGKKVKLKSQSVQEKIRELRSSMSKTESHEEDMVSGAERELKKLGGIEEPNHEQEDIYLHSRDIIDSGKDVLEEINSFNHSLSDYGRFFYTERLAHFSVLLDNEKIRTQTENKIKLFRELINKIKGSLLTKEYDPDLAKICDEILGYVDEIDKLINEVKKL
ncbi:MAG: hypothetical protein KAT77_03210 [Nanoarchaeota archaeon]|nr:hypothetical protein [Nanoarchaeota archaeon]